MKSILFATLCAGAIGVAGCASPALRYYTLVPSSADASTTAAANPAPAPFAIDVLPVGLPEQLDQQRLVIRQGGGSLAVLENERWGGPLSDELRSALSVQLTRRLQTLDVAGLSPPEGRPVLRIKVQMRRFDAWPGDRARLDADWSVAPSDSTGQRRTCHSELDEPTPGTHADMVLGQQRLVARLADSIATAVRRAGPGC